MKKFYILLLFLTVTSYAVAQTHYRSGYIITNDNDTIVGLIDYRTEAMLAKGCSFKVNASSNEQIFLPGQIVGFRFTDEGKFFVTREITIKDDNRTVFLEFLVQGIMNLYFYHDRQTDLAYYFFEDENGKMIEVSKQPDTEILKDGKTYNKPDFTYRGKLKYIVRDVESLWTTAEKTEYRHKDMINLTKNYHNQVCNTGEECIVFETKQDKRFKLKYGIYVGWTPNFGLYTIYEYGMFKHKNLFNSGVSIGGQLNVCNPRFMQSLSLQLDVCLTILSSDVKKYDHSSFLSGTLSGKYTYHKGNIRPMAGLGITLGKLLIGEHLFLDESYHVSAGLNIKVAKEQFIFGSIDYNTGSFVQLKIGFMF